MSYIHTVQYYETDKMGITHHSNYVRWMEEARIDFLAQNGWDYAKLEETGIVSPVLSVSLDYKAPTTFSDRISISVSVKGFKGVKLHLGYEMKDSNGVTVCIASSSHAFLDQNGRPVKLKEKCPGLFETLTSLVQDNG